MDKLTMAHQMALAIQGTKLIHDMELVSDMAWKYADAMQAEANKRNYLEKQDSSERQPDSVPIEVLEHDAWRKSWQRENIKPSLEWQPDWSQAPEWANWWAMDDCDYFWWYEKSPEMKNGGWCVSWTSDDFEKAPSFNYQGNWKDSLRKRPQ